MIEKKSLIGKIARIKLGDIHYKGTIIDETKNMIHLQTGKKVVKIIKKQSLIEINKKTISGNKLLKRPEERIKSK
jgi:RNase P/RNase MRP subunit p29